MKNYYDELEVSKTASKEVIEKVYKVLAKKYHPDTTKEADKQAAEEKFKIISEAYEVLSDDEKRKNYDLELEQTNPTISYEEYINVVNQRDTLNSAFNKLKNEFYQSQNSYNSNANQYYNNQRQYNQSQFNQTQYSQNQHTVYNNYQNQNNVNPNNTNPNSKGKKYYYNTVTGQPVSALDYYKYRIRKFISNIGFYLLILLLLIIAFKNLTSSFLGTLFF